jgi:hypothetical protein
MITSANVTSSHFVPNAFLELRTMTPGPKENGVELKSMPQRNANEDDIGIIIYTVTDY